MRTTTSLSLCLSAATALLLAHPATAEGREICGPTTVPCDMYPGNGTNVEANAKGARGKGRGGKGKGKGSKKLLAGRLKPPPKKAAKKPAKKPAAKRTGKNAGLPPSQEWIGEAPDVTGITEVISPDLLPDRLKPKATGLAAWFG